MNYKSTFMAQQMLKGKVSKKIMIDKNIRRYSHTPYLAVLPSGTLSLPNLEENFLVDEMLIIFVCDEEAIFHLAIGYFCAQSHFSVLNVQMSLEKKNKFQN